MKENEKEDISNLIAYFSNNFIIKISGKKINIQKLKNIIIEDLKKFEDLQFTDYGVIKELIYLTPKLRKNVSTGLILQFHYLNVNLSKDYHLYYKSLIDLIEKKLRNITKIEIICGIQIIDWEVKAG